MVKIEDHCCDCAVPGYPCLGASCPNRGVEAHYCDICGEEAEYWAEGEDLCEKHLKLKFIRED